MWQHTKSKFTAVQRGQPEGIREQQIAPVCWFTSKPCSSWAVNPGTPRGQQGATAGHAEASQSGAQRQRPAPNPDILTWYTGIPAGGTQNLTMPTESRFLRHKPNPELLLLKTRMLQKHPNWVRDSNRCTNTSVCSVLASQPEDTHFFT